MTTTRNNENKQLQFEGIFKGREKEIRVTPDKQVSVFDFIKVVGGQKNPKKTWYDVQNNHKNELGTFCSQFKFPGQGKTLTPVINVQGMVKLLFWLPGELAKQFRSKSAEVMIRYLGGDITLIHEIKAIDQEHTVNPDNIAQIFRHRVSEANGHNDLLLKQIGQSDYMIKHFHAKSILYLGHVEQNEEAQIVKYGHTSDIKSTYRRHQQSYGNEFKFLHVVECKEHYKLESMIKSHNDLQTRHIKTYNDQPRQELIRLDTHFDLNKFIELISDMQSSLKHANQNDHDLTSKIKILELESQVKLQEETTKQMQIEAKIQEEKTKQMEIELRMMELKMLQTKTQDLKPEPAPNTQQIQQIQQTVNDQAKEEQNRKIENLVKKFMETHTEHSVRSQDHIYISDLHHHFEVWYDINKPNDMQQCIPKKVFNEYLVLIGYPTRIRRTIDVIGKNGRKLKKTTLPNRKLTSFPQT